MKFSSHLLAHDLMRRISTVVKHERENAMERHVAIYVRVSTAQQNIRSQVPDLRAWLEAFAKDQPVVWYTDKASGKAVGR